MPISALNFFWLTDPHDLQGILTPSYALSYVLNRKKWMLSPDFTS